MCLYRLAFRHVGRMEWLMYTINVRTHLLLLSDRGISVSSLCYCFVMVTYSTVFDVMSGCFAWCFLFGCMCIDAAFMLYVFAGC
jgi:hypothetical protein